MFLSQIFFADYHYISMGQGQEVHARRLMQQMIANGGWLLLQNCHLSLDYIYEIFDQIVETEHMHEDFRLWVTTEVHPKFPINFLQVIINKKANRLFYMKNVFKTKIYSNLRI